MMQGAGWWIGGAVFMVFCMVMMGWMMRGMMGHGHSAHDTDNRRDDPERTLADRLARGEIDVDEYHRRLDTLRGVDTDGDARQPSRQ